MGLLKWLGIHEHDWTPWEVTGTGEISEGLPPLAQMFTKDPHWHTVGEIRRQERECRSCGRKEVTTEKVYY
jgi:hypothetical protein